jgi:peptide/nickel transport system substrate-binding protein
MDDSFGNTPLIQTTLTKERSMLRFSTLNDLLTRFSPAERLILYVLSLALSISALALLAGANATVSVNVPSRGGSITEGLVGPARFINPVLATSAADADLTALTYSGLVRALPDGTVAPDLAESYTISEDGTSYTFKLRAHATFHDGKPVTSSDVVYTIKEIQNPEVKSPRRSDWDGVAVTAPDDRTVVFTLPHAYAPFIDNCSLGILPEHLWKSTKSEDFPFNPLNTHPVGSGPYRVSQVDTDSTGSATRFDLVPFSGFTLGRPNVSSISMRLYTNEDLIVSAFNRGDINAVAGISSEQLAALNLKNSTVMRATLPRVFGVFLNQNHAAIFADIAVRNALDIAIDKDRLVRATLGGFATPLSGPVPPMNSGVVTEPVSTSTAVSTAYTLDSVDAAKDALGRGGWKWDQNAGVWKKGTQILQFTLATTDTPELVASANAVVTAWHQVGVKVTLKVYPLAELNTTVIRPRDYDALLFGEVIGREPDLYAFWHSSQRNDPGLNLSLYANAKADTLLSQARATTKREDRDKLYTEFADLVRLDQPAVFLYAPDFLYVYPKNVTGVRVGSLTVPAERFNNVYQWYTDTERVWEIFARDTNQTL